MFVGLKYKALGAFILLSISTFVYGKEFAFYFKVDTVAQRALEDDVRVVHRYDISKQDSVSIDLSKKITAVALQQYLKGEAAALYISESTGEPGVPIQMFTRGISKPLLHAKDVYGTQPLIVLDGIPMINDHPFAFDIQQYDIDRIGPENNVFSHIEINNIEEIRVLKDLSTIAKYGPLAANGVIEITSKRPSSDGIKRIAVDSYAGFSARPSVTTINGHYENSFRRQFYDLYTANGQFDADDVYPVYLSDQLNSDYYGPSDWSDSYYNDGLNYGLNASLAGGGSRSVMQFTLGHVKNSGVADQTKLDKYNAQFLLRLQPNRWLEFETALNGSRLSRNRNRNLRNRIAMMGYFPDLSAPLAPNNNVYSEYLDELGKGFDNNYTNILNGHFKFLFKLGKFRYATRGAVDYNEGYRDVFFPSTLLERNNFASNYYGYNQRMIVDHVLNYNTTWGNDHKLYVEAGNVFMWDTYKYNYAHAYKGVNDFIKINLINANLETQAFNKNLVHKFLDRTRHNLISFHGQSTYEWKNRYTLTALVRYDGSSNAQPTSRWFLSPTLSLGWDAKKDLVANNDKIDLLKFRVSGGRLGILNVYDDIAQGPNYTAFIGYTGNLTVPSYNGIAALVRPYESGWIGYDLPWAYMDQVNVGADFGLKFRNITLSLDAYIRDNKNQMFSVPGLAEYGYKYELVNGMDVRNTGLDFSIGGDVVNGGPLTWRSTIVAGFNNNKLLALPNGLQEVVLNNRMLKVGERIDRFWLLENQGIYSSDTDVPVKDNQSQTYNSIPIKAGDPIWADLNQDNVINDDDRRLQGNIIPKVQGSWNNAFQYKNFDLNLSFYFNLGRNVLNQEMANRFSFIENENSNNINAIKEITYWEKRGDYSQYPLYNPWSTVKPYQVNQDLFLENASFVKLRTISLGYDFKDVLPKNVSKNSSIYVYVTANNLFTITPYSGRDPELINYLGYDNGYALPIPKTYALGVKLIL